MIIRYVGLFIITVLSSAYMAGVHTLYAYYVGVIGLFIAGIIMVNIIAIATKDSD